ncbi:hypothetical protein [uncultured Duncaniella sp.]|uniref:hypothetical protein n=1 Tax=uncultured Duncaniella sp. TaxID=2768039 RepID=UPI0025AA218F|nr:hypothetical protein [uncultured Duncaniella sp.]
MKYFVTVNTLQSTTKLGRLLADSVFRRYNNALVHYGEASRIPQYLTEEMKALCTENKRLKPMTVRTSGFTAGKLNKGVSSQIYVVTEAGAKAFSDNRPFTIHLTPVMKDYTIGKGGEL